MTNQVTVSTKSKQDYVTPMWLINKISETYPLALDVACTSQNRRLDRFFTEKLNSLNLDWSNYAGDDEWFWLNPPFKDVRKWMEKCVEQKEKGCKIVTLTLASKGTRWYRDVVRPNALSLIIPRIKFEGQKDVFPKDLMINIFSEGLTGEGYWDIKE